MASKELQGIKVGEEEMSACDEIPAAECELNIQQGENPSYMHHSRRIDVHTEDVQNQTMGDKIEDVLNHSTDDNIEDVLNESTDENSDAEEKIGINHKIPTAGGELAIQHGKHSIMYHKGSVDDDTKDVLNESTDDEEENGENQTCVRCRLLSMLIVDLLYYNIILKKEHILRIIAEVLMIIWKI